MGQHSEKRAVLRAQDVNSASGSTSGRKEVAFGFTITLPAFKRLVPQANNWLDLGLDPYASDFGDQLLRRIRDADAIHFDLTGMRDLNTPDGVLKGPLEWNPVGSTNWELRTIWDTPVLKGKTTFYRDGRIIATGDVPKLP